MKMKTVDLFCASPASTAICSSMNQHAMVRRGAAPRPLHHHHHDHYNNHYQFDFDDDKPKFKTSIIIPCTSQHHIDPKPYNTFLHKNRKSTSSAAAGGGAMVARRKSSADINDVSTPRGSSRHLLSNTKLTDMADDASDDLAVVIGEPVWPDYGHDSPVLKKSPASRRRGSCDSPVLVKSKSSLTRANHAPKSPVLKASRSHSRDQVVELRVSIHCKGCEGKVRKHISRMEGVRSFEIDLESKKVTIVGDVTPLSVLSSVSKVKTAQFWPSSSPFIAMKYPN